MNKLCKIMSTIVLMIAIISISISVNAYTNEDVISYVTRAHVVNGRTEQLNGTQRESLRKYLQENPVTDSEADEIIAKLDQAKALIDNSGATSLSQLSDNIKAEVVSLIKSAGAIAGLQVEVDTVNETVTIKDSNGNIIIPATSYSRLDNGNGKLVYTGNDNSVFVKSIVAIVAIAITGCVLKNKYAK